MLSRSAAALKLVHHHKPELLIKILDSINLLMRLQRCSQIRNARIQQQFLLATCYEMLGQAHMIERYPKPQPQGLR